jgi:DNA repair ATPase RecN
MELIEQFLPYIVTFLVTIIPVIGLVLINISKVKKEVAEALKETGNVVIGLSEIVDALSDSLKDGNISTEEVKEIHRRIKAMKNILSLFKKEWKDVFAAIDSLLKKKKK